MSLDIQWIGIEYKTSWPLHLWNDSQNESYPLWTSPLKHPLNLFTTYKITAKPRERESFNFRTPCFSSVGSFSPDSPSSAAPCLSPCGWSPSLSPRCSVQLGSVPDTSESSAPTVPTTPAATTAIQPWVKRERTITTDLQTDLNIQ